MVTNLGIRCEHFRLRGDLPNRGQHERISRSGASDGLADAGKADGERAASAGSEHIEELIAHVVAPDPIVR
jgi:hypothetical protein